MNGQLDLKSLDQIPMAQLRVWLRGHMGDWRAHTDESRGLPPPPIQKPYPADARLVDLAPPGNVAIGREAFADLVRRQRSRRAYTGEALSNEELSFLLWSTQGISEIVREARGEIDYHLRTVSSAGARHPFETYLAVNRVTGLVPGIYRFLAVEHKLLPVCTAGHLARDIAAACYGQTFAGEAAVLFVWCAVPRRMEWRYAYLAHRMIAMEAGHVCQNLYLAAESIGAGACAILGYDQQLMDDLVGVDGREEFTIYLASVGRAPRQER